MACMLFLTVLVPLAMSGEEAQAAPNPIPILTLSLYPTERRAFVDHEKGDTVTFDGNVTVEQMDLVTSTVKLTGSVNTGWPFTIFPDEFTFQQSGTRKFTVDVMVPPGVEGGTRGDLVVSGMCKVPIIKPVVAAASGVVTVVNTGAAPSWDVRITTPADGTVFATDTLTVSGTASFNLANVTSVEVMVGSGPWVVATGTTEWTVEYDCTYLVDGEHTVLARARAGETEVSPTTEVVVTQDRPEPTPPSGNGGGGGGSSTLQGPVTKYLVIGAVLVAAFASVYWVHRRRERASLEYISTYA